MAKKLKRCDVCGEKRGGARHLLCICEGLRCAVCGDGRIRRPISNHWDEETRRVWHTPWLVGFKPCDVCGASAVKAWWRPTEMAA